MSGASIVGFALFLLASGGHDAAAGAPPKSFDEAFAHAEHLYDPELEYEQALEVLAREAEPLAQTPAQHLEVALLRGVLLGQLNRDAEARDAFRTALQIDARARLPATTAPKIRELFQEARAARRSRPPRSSRPPSAPSGGAPLPRG